MKNVNQALYYERPDLYEIEAKILSIHPRDDKALIVLDPSPFFPGKGGQPGDIGWIGNIPIVGYAPAESQKIRAMDPNFYSEESEESEPTLYPLVDAKSWTKTYPTFREGTKVVCRLDAKHRQEYREQHTGQHLVSALLKNLLKVDTVSVHFGEQTTTIEVSQESLPDGYRTLIQEEANRKILENPLVRTYWINEDEYETISLRRVPRTKGPLRVVEIEGVDKTACSGIHLDRLAPLRLVLILGEERIRGRLRLHLLLGERAIRRLERDEDILSSLRSLCTAGTEELPHVVRGLQEDIRSLTLRYSSLKKEYYFLKMKEWLQAGKELVVAGQRRGTFLCLELGEGEMEDLRFLEEAFLNRNQGMLLLGLVPKGKEGDRVAFLGTHNLPLIEGNPMVRLDLREVFRAPLKIHGGKGGGNAHRFQGSVPSREGWEGIKGEIESFLHRLAGHPPLGKNP
ncbi:MAG: alanyl-tRNA editing protein [Spirochaetes bacterium]|nr:alanyl-tRNA editing protein [Spirochaetota bacterium]